MKTAVVDYPIRMGYTLNGLRELGLEDTSIFYMIIRNEDITNKGIYSSAIHIMNSLSTVEKLLWGWPIEIPK